MDILVAIAIAFSFFTTLPMPMLEWTPGRMKYVPLWLPLIGLAVGAAGWGVFLLLQGWAVSPVLKAAVLAVCCLAFTGGIHMDGMMDTADAYFSRREIERKLEIMKDSRVGAFAVMSLACVMLLRVGLFAEAFGKGTFPPVTLLFIPVLSRGFQSSMIYLFPYAKGEGLAAMYGRNPDRRLLLPLIAFTAAACAGIALLAGAKYLAVPGACALYYGFYYFSNKKQFGGITGDVLGAFLELSELVMLGVAVII